MFCVSTILDYVFILQSKEFTAFPNFTSLRGNLMPHFIVSGLTNASKDLLKPLQNTDAIINEASPKPNCLNTSNLVLNFLNKTQCRNVSYLAGETSSVFCRNHNPQPRDSLKNAENDPEILK